MAKKKDEIKLTEGLSAASRAILSSIPAGQFLSEVMDLRGNIYRARLLLFLERFQEAFRKKLGRDIRPEEFQDEDISDAFAIIAQEVVRTKLEEKKIRFKNLLLNQITNPKEDFLFEKYADLLGGLNELQILILEKLKDVPHSNSINTLDDVAWYFESKELRYAHPRPLSVEVKIGKEFKVYTRTEFLFFSLDLVSKGLLIREQKQSLFGHRLKESYGRNVDVKELESRMNKLFKLLVDESRELYFVSETAKDFLKYIEED